MTTNFINPVHDAYEATDSFYSVKEEHDSVNSPKHYNQGAIEAIDAIRASMSLIEFKGYLKGNIEKYLWRYDSKGNPKQDLRKAKWYLEKLIETYDK